jgi:hypothetical protein
MGFCCPYFLWFFSMLIGGCMVLGLFSIDFVYHVLCVCCILTWFKAKITCNKRYSQFFFHEECAGSSLFFAKLLEFTCLNSSSMWIHLLTYLDWVWKFPVGISLIKYPVSTTTSFSSTTKLNSMSNLIDKGIFT